MKTMHTAAPTAAAHPALARRGAGPDSLESFAKSLGNQGLARIARAPRSATLTDMAKEGETDAKLELPQRHVEGLEITNVGDVAAATAKRDEIKGYESTMVKGAEARDIPMAQVQDNDKAVAALNDYVVNASEQGRSLAAFQEQMQRAILDYGRIVSQIDYLKEVGVVSDQQLSGWGSDRNSSAWVAGALIRSTGFKNAGEMRAQLEKQVGAGTRNVGSIRLQANAGHQSVVDETNSVANLNLEVQVAVHAFQSALSNLSSGIVAREGDLSSKQELADVQHEVEATKEAVGFALGWVTKGLTKVLPADYGDAISIGSQVVGAGANYLIDSHYETKIANISDKIARYDASHRDSALLNNVSQVRQAKAGFIKALAAFKDHERTLETKKDASRTALRTLGAVADGGGEDKVAQVTAILAEVDMFVTQADLALRMGDAELNAAADAREAGKHAFGTRSGKADQLDYWKPDAILYDRKVSYSTQKKWLIWAEGRQTADAHTADNRVDPHGVNAVMPHALSELRGNREWAASLRGSLSEAVGVSMKEAAPRPPAAPAEVQRPAP